MSNNSRRLAILSAKEVDDLYGIPHFTEDERHLYFDLSIAEHEVVGGLQENKLPYILEERKQEAPDNLE